MARGVSIRSSLLGGLWVVVREVGSAPTVVMTGGPFIPTHRPAIQVAWKKTYAHTHTQRVLFGASAVCNRWRRCARALPDHLYIILL